MKAAFLALSLIGLAGAAAAQWSFEETDICRISHAGDEVDVEVRYDPASGQYAIELALMQQTWPAAGVFAIEFLGPRGLTITTNRQSIANGRLVVTDRGFGNVLNGLQFNETAVARLGPIDVAFSLDGANIAVEQFRRCPTQATS